MDMIRNYAAHRLLNETGLPYDVRLLRDREREIATIVYRLKAATAVLVCATLSEPISNAAVRSMLNRLVAKGILKRAASGLAFVYLPALTCADSREMALKRFVDDYFEGSFVQGATTMSELLPTGKM